MENEIGFNTESQNLSFDTISFSPFHENCQLCEAAGFLVGASEIVSPSVYRTGSTTADYVVMSELGFDFVSANVAADRISPDDPKVPWFLFIHPKRLSIVLEEEK